MTSNDHQASGMTWGHCEMSVREEDVGAHAVGRVESEFGGVHLPVNDIDSHDH
jgi:hypothetical protein